MIFYTTQINSYIETLCATFWIYLTVIVNAFFSLKPILQLGFILIVNLPSRVTVGNYECDRKGRITMDYILVSDRYVNLSEYIFNYLLFGMSKCDYPLDIEGGQTLYTTIIARVGRCGVTFQNVANLLGFISNAKAFSTQIANAEGYAKAKAKGKAITKSINPYNSITPLPTKKVVKDKVGVIDIETVKLAGKLYPYAIGFAYLKGGVTLVKTFYITNYGEVKDSNLQQLSLDLINDVCTFIKSNLSGYTLYAHNLGKFDGYFLLKPFYNFFGPYEILIDKSRAIISLTLPGDITFKDSLRILPLSLLKLGNLFDTETKKLEFDHSEVDVKKLNELVFRENVLKYLHNDVKCLLEVLTKVSKIMLEKFNVDLYDCYSTSSLAFNIFRTNYIMQSYIPILPLWLDKIIRTSYRGGSVDVYRVIGDDAIGFKAHYYDVNSLYPHGMCNSIPYKYIGKVYKPDLNKFFGFAYAYIYVPKETKVPLVPVTSESGSLFYPTGHLKGLFFSEELKMFRNMGYKVQTLYGYEFSKADIFSKYVKDLYQLKATTDGSIQKLVKLLLNGLYGYFGRDPLIIVAKFITLDERIILAKTHIIKAEIDMFDGTYIIQYVALPDKDLCSKNGISYKDALKLFDDTQNLKTNVAICSATTSYSRIHIAIFKTLPDNVLLYSDTDSVFLSKPLDPKYINDKILGLIKDELKGSVITRYIFLEPKLYFYETASGKLEIKARGVPKGVMSVEDIMKLYRGETVTYKFTRLYKSFEDITIREKTVDYSLTRNFNRKTPVYNSKGVLIGYNPKHSPLYNILSKSNN
jgi:hypothetical protein